MKRTTYGLCLLALLWAVPAAAALSDADKCEAAKNKEAGKYAFCRQKAEATAIKKGASPDYTKCDSRFTDKWGKAETNGGGMCPTNGDREPMQEFITQNSDDIAAALAGGTLPDCPGDLATCNADLSTCNGNLTTCTAGTATQADVLSGKTFSSSAGTGVTGTMPNNGAVSITPGTSAQSIAAGYHNGSGNVVGDADLTAANIKSGVNIFGVTGIFLPPTCGNGAIDGTEQCDGTDLGGETCASLGFAGGTLTCSGCAFDLRGCIGCPASGQTTAYGPGSDGDVRAGAALSYTDNGDGTITDNNTGLMWEKKSDDGSIHDKDNTYTWGMTSSPYTMNGTMVTTFLAGLNAGSGFAGHTDWRIPNVKELQSIVNYEIAYPGPTVSAVFNASCTAGCSVDGVGGPMCSCTQSHDYWSSTTSRGYPYYAWLAYFTDGTVYALGKNYNYYVRAVRGGL